MRRKDLYWLLATPVYHVLHVLRHELSHAVAAWLQGMQGSFFFLPKISISGLQTSSAIWDSNLSWLTLAMPFFTDLITFLIFFYICMAVPFRARWVWLNLMILGLVSPLVNSVFHFLTGSVNVRAMYMVLPAGLVNLYFAATILFYVVGILLAVFFSRTTLVMPAEEPAAA